MASDDKASERLPRRLNAYIDGVQAELSHPANRLAWVLGMVGCGLVLATVLTIVLFNSWPNTDNTWISRLRDAAQRNPPWLLISGAAAAPAVVLTWWWRTIHKDQDVALAMKGDALAQRQDRTARFFEAVKLLADEQVVTRLGALYSLELLVRDAPQEYGRVIATICGFLRANRPAPDQQERAVHIQTAFEIVLTLERPADDNYTVINLEGAYLSEIRAHGADLSQLNFMYSDLSGASFVGANLSGAGFTQADLTKAILTSADLTGAGLITANLTKADLSNARLRRSDLSGATARWAVFRHADLAGANLTGCDMTGVDLEGARLNGAILVRTVLSGAHLFGVDLAACNMTGALFDARTQFPLNFNPRASGMVEMDVPDQDRRENS